MLTFLFLSLAVVANGCDVTSSPGSWSSVRAHHVFLYAVEKASVTSADFCSSDDFFVALISIDSHVDLVQAGDATKTTTKSGDKLPLSCATKNDKVTGCISHCVDPALEAILIEGAIRNGSLPLDVAEEVQAAMGNKPEWTVSVLQIDLQQPQCKIDYSYFNDVNFCSVIVQVQPSLGFPFRLFLQTSKNLMN